MVSDLTFALSRIDSCITHHEVDRLLRDAGWVDVGAGDWAYALGSPDGEVVARIAPFDPVGPYTVRLYRDAAATGLLPELHGHWRLEGGGDVQILQRLAAVSDDEVRFMRRLLSGDPASAELAEQVRRIESVAAVELPWFGPLDENPSNVMCGPGGQLVLIDPYFADGPNLYAAAANEPDRFVRLIPESERRFMTEIPLASSGPWSAEERQALREVVRAADARLASATR